MIVKAVDKKFIASDDVTLREMVQNHDFYKISKMAKFSCKFTPQELEDRWRQILYDPVVAEYERPAQTQI